MIRQAPSVGTQFSIDVQGLDSLVAELRKDGREVIGPTVRDEAIVYDAIHSAAELPWGFTDRQEAGRCRISKGEGGGCFTFASAANSWKTFLRPAETRLWRSESGDGLRFHEEPPRAPRYAFLGVRPCDLQAIRVQDRVHLEGPFPDSLYRGRREEALIVAVNCSHPSANCFCVSMGCGPRAREGFDLSLTEIPARDRHLFLLEVGSPLGARIVADLGFEPAGGSERAEAERVVDRAAGRMGRHLETTGLKEILYENLDHPRWESVAKRCLACANCTMVCPTCFCTTVFDRPDLRGDRSQRIRRWDSCFGADFSYIHGGAIRPTIASRYRQWLTHKLASWHDQFGVSGCVGCGRCIAWCPVGIDLTEEVRAIRETNGRKAAPEENADGQS